jgi:hypothetical protein
MPGSLIVTDDWSGYAPAYASGATTTMQLPKAATPKLPNSSCLGQRQGIIDFDPEVTDGALDLRMSERTRVIMHLL